MVEQFNPTKKDLTFVENLILTLRSKKNKLIERKIIIQDNLSKLKEKYQEVDLKSKEFYEIKNKRQEFKEIFNEIEIEIKSINDELNYKNKLKLEIEFHLKHNKQLEGKEDLDKITTKIKALKVKYANFAKDRTRIASLRIMASEIIDELDNILK